MKRFKTFFLSTAIACPLLMSAASEPTPDEISSDAPTEVSTPRVKIDGFVRVDWQNMWNDGHSVKSNSGFEGKYLMFRIDGYIIDGLTYSWRQRLNKAHSDANFFDATDWIYLDYAFKGWNFQAGKEIVAIGGWEYDANPINIFAASTFWNNINCYELGVSAAYSFTPSSKLMAQICQSPFFTRENRSMYGYSLYWAATHGCWQPLWSANLFEYNPGKYISYLSLGNRFNFGKVHIDLDLMNRAASGQTFFFKDCSLMAEAGWAINDRWNVSGKFTYDVNKTLSNADMTVLPGTEIKMAGAAVEFYPLKKNRTSLRLHAGCYYSWGTNANEADFWQNKTLLANVGLTWDINIFTLK